MTQGIGFKSTLAIGIGSGSATVIGGIVDGWETEAETEMVDVTLLGDTYKSFLPADTDPGELAFDVALNVSDAQLIALQAAQKNGTLVHATVTYSNGGTENSTGFIKTIGRTVKKRELLTSKIVIKESGDPGFAVS